MSLGKRTILVFMLILLGVLEFQISCDPSADEVDSRTTTATAAIPTPTPQPTPTPFHIPTQEEIDARITTAIASIPTPVPLPTPTPIPTLVELIQIWAEAVVIVKSHSGTGSGFFVSADGMVVTAAHVVQGAFYVDLVNHRGEVLLAKVLRTESEIDIAVLQVLTSAPNQGFVQLSSRTPKLGEQVYALGYPLSSESLVVTQGIISSIRNEAGTWVVQTDTPVNPGNSGGPLIDSSGNVVGIVTAKLVGRGVEGIGFAVTAYQALSLIDQSKQLVDSKSGFPAPVPTGFRLFIERATGFSLSLPQQWSEKTNVFNIPDVMPWVHFWREAASIDVRVHRENCWLEPTKFASFVLGDSWQIDKVELIIVEPPYAAVKVEYHSSKSISYNRRGIGMFISGAIRPTDWSKGSLVCYSVSAEVSANEWQIYRENFERSIGTFQFQP